MRTNLQFKIQKLKLKKILKKKNPKRIRDLSGTHCGLQSGETVVEGAENGNHAVGDGLALSH